MYDIGIIYCPLVSKEKDTLFWARQIEMGQCNICLDNVLEPTLWRNCKLVSDGVYSGFCMPCIREYLAIQIETAHINPNGSVQCPCQSAACLETFPKDAVFDLLPHAQLREKYESFCLNAAVQHDSNLHWCPNPACTNIIETVAGQRRAVCSSCTEALCISCGSSHSRFMPCGMARDASFQKWKSQTVEGCKRCPGCRIYIEKNTGCPHMTCVKCRHQFCWHCLSSWRGGCTSPGPYCAAQKVLNHDVWGDDLYTRTVTKTVAMPILLGVGAVGVGGAAVVGAGAVVCGVAAGTGMLIAVPLKLAYDAIPFPWKPPPPTPVNYTHAEMLQRGFRAELPREVFTEKVEALNLEGGSGRFMGFEGRLGADDAVFVAYHTFNNCSAIIYFTPEAGDDERVDEIPEGVTDLALVGIEDTERNDQMVHLVDACIRNTMNVH